MLEKTCGSRVRPFAQPVATERDDIDDRFVEAIAGPVLGKLAGAVAEKDVGEIGCPARHQRLRWQEFATQLSQELARTPEAAPAAGAGDRLHHSGPAERLHDGRAVRLADGVEGTRGGVKTAMGHLRNDGAVEPHRGADLPSAPKGERLSLGGGTQPWHRRRKFTPT